MLEEQEYTVEIDVHQFPHRLAVKFLDTALVGSTAGIDDQRIQFTQPVLSSLQAGLYLQFISNITGNETGSDALGCLCTILAPSRDDDLRTTGDKLLGDRQADARRASGDECRFALECVHNSFLVITAGCIDKSCRTAC